jgi:diguanylate cyclase (GGDEF)-like protein
MAHKHSGEVTVVAPLSTITTPHQQEGRKAQLVVLSGTNVGQVFNLPKSAVTIGRDANTEIQILDAGISRRHAMIYQDKAGQYLLKDAGSRNGTFANNHQIEGAYALQDGDKIQIGVMTILKFSYNNEPEAHYAEAMYEAALRDGLTGLFNRRYFEKRLTSEFSYALRHGASLALLMLDLDHFKAVNDSFGHVAGDQLLKDLSQLILKACRTEDVLSRYGGEEFTLLCRDTDLLKASVLGERIRHDVASCYFNIAGAPSLRVSVSIGVAALPDTSITTAEGLILAADEALYRAKERGRNCVVMRQSPINR